MFYLVAAYLPALQSIFPEPPNEGRHQVSGMKDPASVEAPAVTCTDSIRITSRATRKATLQAAKGVVGWSRGLDPWSSQDKVEPSIAFLGLGHTGLWFGLCGQGTRKP